MTRSRAVRSWAQLALQVSLLVIGLASLQIVAERTNRVIDLTPGRSLTLSPVTRNVLGLVDAPMSITVFHRRGERAVHTELLRRIRDEQPHITFAVLDLDRHPDRARGLGVSQYGRAAIEYAERRVVTLALPEEHLAGGILRAVRGRPRRIVFTTGHGERTPGGDDAGYGRLVGALAAENYAVETVSLLAETVPAQTDVLVIAGPRHDFLPQEIEAVAAYLRAGGGVLVLLEPGSVPNLSALLASMGVRVGDDFVVDRERRVLGTDGLAAVVELFKRGNPVSDPSDNPIETGAVLPSARTVDVVGDVPGIAAESIARTAPTSWAVADPDRARRGDDPSQAKRDVPGSASVMVMGEVGPGGDGTGRPRGRLVVVGDADFASDAYLDLLGNRDLAMNAVAWVAGEESLAAARPKQVPEVVRPLSPLVLTERQARGLLFAVAVVEPGLILALGVGLAIARRRRG